MAKREEVLLVLLLGELGQRRHVATRHHEQVARSVGVGVERHVRGVAAPQHAGRLTDLLGGQLAEHALRLVERVERGDRPRDVLLAPGRPEAVERH